MAGLFVAMPATPAQAQATATALYFRIGSSQPRLGATERRQLEAMVKASQGAAIQVVGHADNTGTAQLNQDLSELRAQAAKRVLVSLGARAEAVHTVGQGDRQPAQSNDDAAGRAMNRRVDIELK